MVGPTLDPPPAIGAAVIFSDALAATVIEGTVARARLVDGTFTTLVDVPSDPSALVANIASATIAGQPYVYTEVTDQSNVVEVLDTRLSYNIQYAVSGSPVVDVGQRLQVGDVLHQDVTINGISRRLATAVVEDVSINVPLGIYIARIRRIENTIRTDLPFYGERTETVYTITSIPSLEIGVDPITINTLVPNATLYTDPQQSGVVANVTGVFSYTDEASFILGDIEATHTITNGWSAATIQPMLATTINSASYLGTAEGYGSTIAAYATAVAEPFEDIVIGQIGDIIVTNPGRGYPIDPFFIVYDPRVDHLQRHDYVIRYTPSGRNFIVGERIFVRDREFLAQIVRHDRNKQFIYATRLHLGDVTSTTSISNDLRRGEVIEGDATGITATVETVFEHRTARRTGRNAIVNAEAIDGEGFATVVEVIDSGFGYSNEQPITLASINNPTKRIETMGYLGQFGIGQGYHASTRSFLSSDKYIHDNDYYQEYSYEIQAPLPFSEYSQTIKDVLHVAGTKPFGKYVATNDVSITLTGAAAYGQIEGYITIVIDGGDANAVVTNVIDGQDAASPRTATYDGGDVYRDTT